MGRRVDAGGLLRVDLIAPVEQRLVAALHVDGDDALRRRRRHRGAHGGALGRRRHGTLAALAGHARVGGAAVAEVDGVAQSVLRQASGGRGAALRLRGGRLLAGRGRRKGRLRLRRRRRRLFAGPEPAAPARGKVLSELGRDVVEGESVEAAEVAEICNSCDAVTFGRRLCQYYWRLCKKTVSWDGL